MKKLLAFVFVLTFGLGACRSESDELAVFDGGTVTRGDLRWFYTILRVPENEKSLTTDSQINYLKQLATLKMVDLEMEKQGLKKEAEYTPVQTLSDHLAKFTFLSIENKNRAIEDTHEFRRLQILYKRFPSDVFSRPLTGAVDTAAFTRDPEVSYPQGQAILYAGPGVATGESAKVANGTRVKILARDTAEPTAFTAGGESAYWYRVKAGEKTGFVHGINLRYFLSDSESEQRRKTVISESKNLIAKLAGLSGEERDRFIALETDDNDGQTKAGIKAYQASVEAEMPGNAAMDAAVKLKEGEVAPEPIDNGQGLEFIVLRDIRKTSYNKVAGLMEDHFEEMARVSERLSRYLESAATEPQNQNRKSVLEKLNQRIQANLKKDNVKLAPQYAERSQTNILRAAELKMQKNLLATAGYEFRENADFKDPETILVKTPKRAFRAADADSELAKISDAAELAKLTPQNRQNQAVNLARILLFADYFDGREWSGGEMKRYAAVSSMVRLLRQQNYFLNRKPADAATGVTEEDIQKYYNNNKNSQFKVTAPDKSVSYKPIAEVKETIRAEILRAKNSEQRKGLINNLPKTYNLRINNDAIVKGKI